MANKVQKRKYVIGLLVLLAMAAVSTYAWSYDISVANSDPAHVYVSSSPTTDWDVDRYSVVILGYHDFKVNFWSTGADSPKIQFMFLTSTGTPMTVSGSWTVALYDSSNSTVACTLNATNHIWETDAGLAAGEYYVKVSGATSKTVNCVSALDGTNPFVAFEIVVS